MSHTPPSAHVPQVVAERVRRPVPENSFVVPGSTPVVSFGDFQRAVVATVGINPSRREFDEGGWLTGAERRLATHDSLGVTSLEDASDAVVARVVSDCNTYFRRNPYWRWFGHLETLLRTAGVGSYLDDDPGVCHLDLVQWATDPVWGAFPPEHRGRKAALIAEDREFLRAQLATPGLSLVFLNGRSVIDEVRRMGVALEGVGRVVAGGRRSEVLATDHDGTTFIAWSQNLQSSRGLSTALRVAIAERVGELTSSWRSQHASPATRTTFLQVRGTLSDRQELIDALGSWVAGTPAPTVGDVDTFGGRAWARCRAGDVVLALNADTTRVAAQTLVDHVRQHGLDDWSVVANRHGNVNRVAIGGDLVPGLYLYTTRRLQAPRFL